MLVDIGTERWLDEILGVTYELILDRIRRMVKEPVQSPLAAARYGLAIVLDGNLHLRRRWQSECGGDARPPEDMARSLVHGHLYSFHFR